MRVAALYDIHGNLPALEAVLSEIAAEGVDQIVVGGDVVPGPMPGESLAALLDLSIPVHFIHGNGERDILAARERAELTRVPELYREMMHWVADVLSAEQIAAISQWPRTCRLDAYGLDEVLFCHATPRDDNEIFTRLTPEERLRPIFEAAAARVVVCVHTHMQFDRQVASTRVVSAGSVGMPFGIPGAYWLLLERDHINFRVTRYDLSAAADRIRTSGYPTEFEVLRPASEEVMLGAFETSALRL